MHRSHIILCLFIISTTTKAAIFPSARLLTGVATTNPELESETADPAEDSYLESQVFNTVSDEDHLFRRHTGLHFAVSLVHLILLAAAFYTCFLGYRHYKLLLCIQGFISTFVYLMLALQHSGVFKPARVSHHLGILFVAFFLAGNLLLACSVFIRLNYVFFGLSLSCIAYFFFEEAVKGRVQGVPYGLLLAALLVASTAVIAFLTFRFFKVAVQVNSALVGGFCLVLCVEVLTHNFSSFYDPNFARRESLSWFVASWAVAAGSGLFFQNRMKAISDKAARDSDIEEINRRSYLA